MDKNIENEKYNNMVEYLRGNIEVLSSLVQDCNSYNGSLEDFIWYEHDNYFYDDFFRDREEVARAVYYGGDRYNYCDPYVRFNAYGNLETCCDYEREKDLIDNVEEILDTWLDLRSDNNVDTWDNEFENLVRTFYEEESDVK